MLCKHYTEEILGLQGVKVTKVENSEEKIEIYAVLPRTEHHCIGCGAATGCTSALRLPTGLAQSEATDCRSRTVAQIRRMGSE